MESGKRAVAEKGRSQRKGGGQRQETRRAEVKGGRRWPVEEGGGTE